jgi:hypothetical protein
MANAGRGLGRYLALNAVNGAVLYANNELEAIDVTGFSIAFRHLWNEQWRSNLTYSIFSADNDSQLTGLSVVKETYSARANILYSPGPEQTFGAQYAYAKKTLKSDADMSRMQFSAQ